ncbi:hypothetical protein SLA2020_396000 [Shorea laevis]
MILTLGSVCSTSNSRSLIASGITPLFLLDIADYKLCYLWFINESSRNRTAIYLAKVGFFIDENAVTIHPVKKVDVETFNIFSCLPLSVPQERAEVKKSSWSGSQTQVDCKNLMEEI